MKLVEALFVLFVNKFKTYVCQNYSTYHCTTAGACFYLKYLQLVYSYRIRQMDVILCSNCILKPILIQMWGYEIWQQDK